jgi:lysyl-tRNA synthetase class 2
MQPVESSCVAKIGYDAAAKEAYVKFLGGGLYAYRDVPAHVFDDFANADSKGTFVNTVIKPRYSVRKIGPAG